MFTTPAGISKIPAACTGPTSCLETTVMAGSGNILLPLVIDDTHVYWAEHTTAVVSGPALEPSAIKRISLASGVVETMAPDAINVTDMVGVGDYIYWAETAAAPATGKVWKLAK